jgi:hypothetical protein
MYTSYLSDHTNLCLPHYIPPNKRRNGPQRRVALVFARMKVVGIFALSAHKNGARGNVF